MEVKATVTFVDQGEAARWLAAYCSPPSEAPHKACAAEFQGTGAALMTPGAAVSRLYIAAEAVRVLAAAFGIVTVA